MAASHDPELKETARRLMEEDGLTLSETARQVGVAKSVVHDWATGGEWKRPEVVRRVRIDERKVVVDPALDAVLQRLEKLGKAEREAAYDEEMHKIATSVPFLIRQLPHHEVVAKADKIAKLAEFSRLVLGRQEGRRPAAMLSLGILSAPPIPDRLPARELDAEVIDAQPVTLSAISDR